MFITVFIIAAIGLAYAFFNYYKVKSYDKGTEKMREVAEAIREGANAFLFQEYKILFWVVIVLTIIFGVFLQISSAVAFVIGVGMSGLAGFFGMSMSTQANVRVTNEARVSKDIGSTLKVALRGGAVMGLSVSVFALAGLSIVFFMYGDQMNNLATYTNWAGLSFTPISMTLSSYALGCSTVAMFNRIGGGIYTKAADMGADLVGKTEANIPEDDPRNPAVIADCVGDNVGDTAGLGSDLLESYMGAITSAIVLAIYLYVRFSKLEMSFSQTFFEKLYVYPVLFSAVGLVACMIGLAYVFHKKNIKDPHKALNLGTWLAAFLTAAGNFVLTMFLFNGEDIGDLPFRLGIYSPYVAAVFGVIAGIILGVIAEYYTSYDYKPTQTIAEASKEGAAITITQGLAIGMKSTLLSLIVLSVVLLAAYLTAGMYGIAMAAVGMLSFVSITVSVDTYGPISDNAGGIAEMCCNDEENSSEIRAITDKLDAVGNTTAAIGKGFAIGSAAFAAVSLMISFIYSFTPMEEEVSLDLMNPVILAGVLVGSAITFYFSGLLIEAVAKSAKKMVDEVRRQFREIPGIMEGTNKPDYKRCVEISTKGALAEMKLPSFISIVVPVACGFLLGPYFVAGILMGATISAILLAIFCGNSGGAWDNSKKYIESLGNKGSDEHKAAVIGDTVGDPLKDTVGPSLDILIKIMSTIALLMASFFSQYNLADFLASMFK